MPSVLHRSAPGLPRRTAFAATAALVLTLLVPGASASTSGGAVAEPWHARAEVLTDVGTGPSLPQGEDLEHVVRTGPDTLAVSGRRTIEEIRSGVTEGRRWHTLRTVVSLEESSPGIDELGRWRARLLDDGGVVAFVCAQDTSSCIIRVRSGEGTWRTLSGGGARYVEPSSEPGLPSWTPLPVPVGTVDYASAAPSSLAYVLPTQLVVDTGRNRLYFDQRGLESSLWSIDLSSGALARVGQPDRTVQPPVTGVGAPVSALALLQDGRLLVSDDVQGVPLRVVDLATDQVTPLALPTARVIVPTPEGDVWLQYDGDLVRHGLDGTERERFSGDDMARLGLYDVQPLLLLDHPGGLLTVGGSRFRSPWGPHGPVTTLPEQVRVLRTGPGTADAPTTVSAVAGENRAVVSWNAAYGYGRPVTGYVVTASPGGRSVTVGAGVTSATVTGLSNAVAHRFVVRSLNEVGSGDASTPSAPVTPRDVTAPGPVTPGTTSTATGVVRIRWTPPSDADFAGVTVVRKTGEVGALSPADGVVVYRGAGNTHLESGLAAGTGYTFTVFSRDSAGNVGPREVVQVQGARLALTTMGSRGATTVVTHGSPDHFSQHVVVTGTDGAPVVGREVTVQVRKRGSTTWSTVARLVTDRSGAAAATHRPVWNAEYRAVFGGTSSGTVTGNTSGVRRVDVRVSVPLSTSGTSVRRGTAVSLTGSVGPAHPGMLVRLERRSGSGWVKAGEVRLSSSSSYRFSVSSRSAGTATYRVTAVGDADHLGNTSGTRTVTWS